MTEFLHLKANSGSVNKGGGNMYYFETLLAGHSRYLQLFSPAGDRGVC
jgi:hypothetical protein